MSKLWIVHRNPQSCTALARISGRAASEIVTGAPVETNFAESPKPAAVVLGLEGDFELELEFVHRLRSQLHGCRWILLASPEDATEAARLFGLSDPEILDLLPTPRVLRAHIASAFARRRAESLTQRRIRQRVADRFSAWFGGLEIPGLLRSLDPSLSHLPLLIRGVPGSGRALLARYVELFRTSGRVEGGSAPGGNRAAPRASLRIHSNEVGNIGELARRIAASSDSGRLAAASIWIDEVDSLQESAQVALAEWIVHETSPVAPGLVGLHWVATAGPSRWQDPLEPALERAFAPLIIEIPALSHEPDALPTFANEIARDWSRSVGGPARHLSTAALAEMALHPWQGDRAEVEAVLRASFASTSRDPVDAEDLRFGVARIDETPAAAFPSEPEPLELPVVEAIPDGEAPLLEVEDLEAIDEPAPTIRQEATPAEHESDSEPETIPEGLDMIAAPVADFGENAALSDASFDIATSEEIAEVAEHAETQDNALDPTWRKLARSLSHEIRNPLVSIRTFAELLPEHYADETFRARFADLVGRDVAHIDNVVTRMQDVAERDPAALEATDVSALIEELLDERRERIAMRRLLVLRELEREAPLAWAEPASLRVALAGLLDRALDSLPERGDLFVATRHVERGQDGEPRLRILLRHHNPEARAGGTSELAELRPEANVIEYVLAETIARASGGSLTLDTSDAQESLILFELRTPN
jgi:DNA-binding NtrC family response regulator